MLHFDLTQVSDSVLEHLQSACKAQIEKYQEDLASVNVEITRRKMQQNTLFED